MSVTCSPHNISSIVVGKTAGRQTVGILALQGDVSLHAIALHELGIEAVHIKMPQQLKDLDGLIIPGGESTALLRLAEPIGMLEAITVFAQSGGAILGTCAGAILLATKVTNPAQQSLGLIDITIRRNGYGRQINSSEVTGQGHPPLSNFVIPMTFIRAPRITILGKAVKVLASYQDEPVLVEQGNIMAATFHPELQANTSIYEYWLTKLGSPCRM
jgi:5'-phosphate synthase pdxT subunit